MTAKNVEQPQCWAYNKERQRCQLHAGHDSLHSIMNEWEDSECFDPLEAPKAVPVPFPVKVPAGTGTTTPTVTINTNPAKCIACGHQHRNGECKCGCYEFVG